MLERILKFVIAQRWLVLLVTLGMAMLGIYNYQRLPIDAVPDITNVQVQINTEAAGYSPLEAEQRITFPIETAMAGLPNLEQTRTPHLQIPQQARRILVPGLPHLPVTPWIRYDNDNHK